LPFRLAGSIFIASFAKKIAGELDVGRFGRTLGEFDVV
jgi:hypothetical protein